MARPPQHVRRRVRGELSTNAPTAAVIADRTRDGIDETIDTALRTGRPAIPPRPQAPAPGDDDVDMAGAGVAAKLQALSTNPGYQREYKLRLMHRMIIRQISMDLIARTLDVPLRTAYRLREELYAQLREEATQKDLPTYVGMTDGFYNDIIGMSMRMASSTHVSDIRKLGAMQVALQAQRDRVHFYEVIGFHDVMKVSPLSGMTDRSSEQATRLINMAENIIGVFEEVDEGQVEGGRANLFNRERSDEDEDTPLRVL